jgi:uroporphyrinogen-III decarboxylase
MIWMFDATNMQEVRRHLGGHQCFGGNVPGALLTTGTAQEVEAYVRQLIDDVAGPGGFVLGSGIVIDEARSDCVKAMIDAGKKYGAQV